MGEVKQLKRELGVGGAVLVGLGSILGTGVFAIVGLGTEMVGGTVIYALLVAALLAVCNGLNSAQLAAAHPVSGGTYEYGYKYLTPSLGFLAGWMFLLAKSASAATAALALSAYARNAFEWEFSDVLVALVLVILLTVLVLSGVRRTNTANLAIVGTTCLALAAFIVAGLVEKPVVDVRKITDTLGLTNTFEWRVWLEVCALVFVGYTGYGRIATMGEEISEPRRNIPRAMWATLGVSALLYIGVALVVVRHGHIPGLALNEIANLFAEDWVGWLLTIGAATALLGVLVNLLLGLSRMLLAMGRRQDLWAGFGVVGKGDQPRAAVIGIGILIGGLTLLGDIKLAWSFSAFTVLLYYAVCNLAALKLPDSDRLYPKWIGYVGLAGCVFLAFWVPVPVWLTGLGAGVAGLIIRALFRASSKKGINESRG